MLTTEYHVIFHFHLKKHFTFQSLVTSEFTSFKNLFGTSNKVRSYFSGVLYQRDADEKFGDS